MTVGSQTAGAVDVGSVVDCEDGDPVVLDAVDDPEAGDSAVAVEIDGSEVIRERIDVAAGIRYYQTWMRCSPGASASIGPAGWIVQDGW